MIRTTYMQNTMTATYPGIVMEAVKNGFDGAWQRLIANKLLKDYKSGNSEAECIIQSVGGSSLEKRLKAANNIINSKIPEHDTIG